MRTFEIIHFLPVVYLDTITEDTTIEKTQQRLEIALSAMTTRNNQCFSLLKIYESFKGNPPASIKEDIDYLFKIEPMYKSFMRVHKIISQNFDGDNSSLIDMEEIKILQIEILLELLNRYKMSSAQREDIQNQIVNWHAIGNKRK